MGKNSKNTTSSNLSGYITLFIVLIPTFLVIGAIARGLAAIFFKVAFFSSDNWGAELFITWLFGVIGATLMLGAMISIGFLAKIMGLVSDDAPFSSFKNNSSSSTNLSSSSWDRDYGIEREKPKKPSWGDLIFDSFDPKHVEEVNKHIEEKKREEQEYLNRKYPGKNQ